MTKQELLEALRAATGPSRELDAKLMFAAGYARRRRFIGAYDDASNEPVLSEVWVDTRTDKWMTTATHGFEFTASLDAANALRERMLPESAFVLNGLTKKSATVSKFGFKDVCNESCANLPISLCAAVIAALIAQETNCG